MPCFHCGKEAKAKKDGGDADRGQDYISDDSV
eukprot:CAMPEP_0113433572 /NCGR_PEP_ID=MMETSP0013_2-20120614/34976_1 /TAXON_ID=2843 ORGANISM="Skeletonema costatum, Strain 1716" /NCGR_SAMPLE_ID=MMETSP0013_2 /ASSEMBLY_ACC=CAM_ASM_000158 /LENGTH=31 /DNA_ID=CAMNT_0000323213 /DNA_START=63 /DNA_END=155 /DNA_ORIENTATION=- /assembly_acc=CAM_ASM_000158